MNDTAAAIKLISISEFQSNQTSASLNLMEWNEIQANKLNVGELKTDAGLI